MNSGFLDFFCVQGEVYLPPTPLQQSVWQADGGVNEWQGFRSKIKKTYKNVAEIDNSDGPLWPSDLLKPSKSLIFR